MEDKNSDLNPIAQLITKSILGELTDAEKVQLEDWLNEREKNREIYESYKNGERLADDLDFFFNMDMDSAWKSMQTKVLGMEGENHIEKPVIRSFFKYYKIGIAAAVLIVGGWLTFFTLRPSVDPGIVKDTTGRYKNDVLPGEFQALLTLSNGKKIKLKDHQRHFSEQDGVFAEVGEASGSYNEDQQLYHTLSVPKGATYNFTLADGSKVFMNGESELQFPISFNGKGKRDVKLKGEAYFEVFKNKLKPFVIEVGGTSIEVLGTEFNVNATHKNVKTTLVEGSVKLKAGNGAALILKPGELGKVSEGNITKEKADLRKMLAWKNNEFYFKDDRFVDVLSQLALWYDLDVEVEKRMENILISGSIGKDVKLSETLGMLSYVIKGTFKVEGRKLIVTQ